MDMIIGRIELGAPQQQPPLYEQLHPPRQGYRRGSCFVRGPREAKPRLLIAYWPRAGWCWYWKKAGTTVCVELGPVERMPTPAAAWRYAREMDAALEVF